MDSGRRIKELRKKAGLTQSQLAEMLGFKTPFYLSQLETGKREAGLSVLGKICNALGISISEFFKGQMPKTISLRQSRIANLLEGVQEEKQKLIKKYIETVKDMDTNAIKETLLYAQKEKLWRKITRRK
ncbi:MAG: helix-turn-helix transcriptional regulator [Nitrospirae bacterium]|nr:helix-turn-helix transcriptional regulator [Nitrospirota bacterium]